jgi:PAS domain S-box-containing protein
MLSTYNVLSILMIPIFVKDTFYGFIGFDDCNMERVWTTDQLNVIRSLASNIANAIERVKNERVIRETEYNLTQINETIRDVFWLYDMQLQKYIYMSPSCEKVLGMAQEDFYAGKDYGDRFVVEEDLPKMRAAMKSLADQPFYEVEYRIRHKDGIRWIYEKSSAIRDSNGVLVRNAGTCSDITEKKLTQEKVTQLSLVAEKTTNGILIADKDGKTLWANEAYLRMFEIPESELIGRRPRDLFKTDEEHVKTISRLNSSNYTLEFEVNTFRNTRKWVELTCTAIMGESGEVTHQVEVLSDITEKIRTRQELQEHLLDLEFQNVLKERLISAGSIREITEKALGLIQQRMKSCIHISLLTLDEHKTHLEGYYLKGDVIERESHPIKDIKSYEKIKDGKIFIENDLRITNELSVSDQILLQYGAVSYAVVPIMEEKELTGMITITFDAPIHINYAEKGNLVGFAYILSTTIRHLRLKNSLEEKNKDIEESLYYAQSIQKTILPDLRENFPSLQNVAVFFKPRDIVSGDFYWAYENAEHLFIAIGDCTGHGVPGAFLTLIGSRILEQIVHLDGITTPSEILRRLDRQLFLSLSSGTSPDISDGMEIALCAINKPGKYLTFSGAGMGLLYFVNNTEHYIKGMLTSIGENRKEGLSLPDHRVELEKNQYFYMASDGYQDQLGGAHFKRFSKQKLIALLGGIKDLDAGKQEEKLEAALTEYMGSNHQTDDISLIGFKIK